MFLSLPIIIAIGVAILWLGAWFGYQEREREFEATLTSDERTQLYRNVSFGQTRETFAAFRWRRQKLSA